MKQQFTSPSIAHSSSAQIQLIVWTVLFSASALRPQELTSHQPMNNSSTSNFAECKPSTREFTTDTHKQTLINSIIKPLEHWASFSLQQILYDNYSHLCTDCCDCPPWANFNLLWNSFHSRLSFLHFFSYIQASINNSKARIAEAKAIPPPRSFFMYLIAACGSCQWTPQPLPSIPSRRPPCHSWKRAGIDGTSWEHELPRYILSKQGTLAGWWGNGCFQTNSW